MIKFNENDIFLVTGASSGLGLAISKQIIDLGGKVIGVARNLGNLINAKNLSSNPDNFFTESKDITEDIDNIDKWLIDTSQKYGKLKGLVLSAGIQETMPVSAIKISQSKKIFEVNFFSNLGLVKGFSKKKSNIGQGSSIVFISSYTSLLGVPGLVNYSASKGAVNSAVKTLAVEYARDGIRVNAILPGHIITDLFNEDSKLGSDFIEKLKSKYPLGLGKPEDVANLTVFLLSDASRWITGSNIVIDGGASILF